MTQLELWNSTQHLTRTDSTRPLAQTYSTRPTTRSTRLDLQLGSAQLNLTPELDSV